MLSATTFENRKLILVELNEVNFDVAAKYLQNHELPSIKKLLTGVAIRTSAEKNYEELEPWVQWPSVHSGLTAKEHGVFRLGDIVGTKVPQMFEQLERQGITVGCISAMNAENRLKKASYFIPDPWTKTASDKTWWSRVLSEAVSQTVNDNSQARISAKSAFHLILSLGRFAKPAHYGLYWRLARKSRGAPWRKALLLDLLLHDIHQHLFAKKKPNFSTIFLNAGAYIQHHYFFNAKPVQEKNKLRNPSWYISPEHDPVVEMLEIYDKIIEEYLNLENVDIIVATGLSQKPYDRVKYYYRLKDHAAFLHSIGLKFSKAIPRMTRDFLIEFENNIQAKEAEQKLFNIKIAKTGESLFGEIDNRGNSLFVSMTYPHEIDETIEFVVDGKKRVLAPNIVFVAIKNGMHQEEGFAFFTTGVAPYAPKNKSHVKNLYSSVMRYFMPDAMSLGVKP